jgi:hypothetical protein
MADYLCGLNFLRGRFDFDRWIGLPGGEGVSLLLILFI